MYYLNCLLSNDFNITLKYPLSVIVYLGVCVMTENKTVKYYYWLMSGRGSKSPIICTYDSLIGDLRIHLIHSRGLV